ncbi:MAG: tetratricopeptide repeat protein [Candidatus Zixiibacteriota bacterium]|nr:MAG: tetratricopeptide repeat protein [candidate division Zixibacteria bacterium]
MRRNLTILSTVLVTLIAVGLFLASGCGEKAEDISVAPTEIEFVTNYDSVLATAQQKGQKAVIDFYTEWCTWCKRLDTVTFVDSTVIELAGTMVFGKIDAEKDTVTAKKYGVSGYPTVLLINDDGSEIDRIAGYLPPDEFTETINNYLKDIGTLADYLRKADTNATTEVNYVLGEKYTGRGMYDEARSYYEKVIKVDPDNEDGHTEDAMMGLADLLLREKEYDKSIVQLDKVIKKFRGSETATEAELWIAYAERKKGDTAAAILTYEKYIKNHPESENIEKVKERIENMKNPPPPEEEGQ